MTTRSFQKRTLAVSLVFLLLATLLTACGADSSKNILGEWYFPEYSIEEPFLEFFSDGTMKNPDSNELGSWSITDEKLKISAPDGQTEILTIETLDKEQLVLSYHGEQMTLIKGK